MAADEEQSRSLESCLLLQNNSNELKTKKTKKAEVGLVSLSL